MYKRSFIEVCSQGPTWWEIRFSLRNNLAPNNRKPFIWKSDDERVYGPQWVKHIMIVCHPFMVLLKSHYNDVLMSAMASQITSLTIFYSAVYSGADQRKHQSPASLAFVRGIHRWPVNSPHKGPVTRKMFPFDDVIIMFSDTGRPHTIRKIWIWTNPE